ncbi:protein AF-9 [Adelges cooleyi]|uniref:protein AF-9 n=1 Tax=Adelges cooleyi TaxID=133065 RepID=UPI002180189D|nr:protein AF-9 [Adelges cooleyi]
MNMAFPYVKVIFEIGHEASVRNKRTPEGFTHDWELFVRGADNTDIHFFVDKVVFHLHETFPNPRRIIKEPPYVVKESGYAGFPLPIDIYVRNKDEPRKIRFNYELTLQDKGSPPMSRVTRETYIFNPSEDFRRKLIKGGGTSVLSHDGTELKNSSSSSAISKPKSSTNINRMPSPPPKKHKREDVKLNNKFESLFGSPIQPSKLPLTTSKSSTLQKSTSSDKSQLKIKSSPHHKEEKEKKDKEKEKERDKEKKKSKELSVDKVKKEKDKDKEKKEKSKESSDKSKSLKTSSSKPDKKDSSHHDKIKDKSNDIKIEKKESKDKTKRDDKVKEKIKDKSHKDEKSYHETKVRQEIKIEFIEQEKKKHKSSPESIKIKSDKKLEKSEKSSKPHKSHKEHKKRDKRDKEEKEKKKDDKPIFVEQEPTYKHVETPKQNTNLDNFPKVKEEFVPECSPHKATSSRILESESEEGFLSEDSEPPYQPLELPKSKETPKKKLSPENNGIKKKKRKKKERDVEESRPKVIRTEITEEMRETCSDISRSPSPSPSSNKFTDEYINSLKNLQHKIMMLEDEDLQRVVTVIAETGHYEITTKTFDFDLCALNETTVKKLQELIT